jgi:hypothetical protein
MNISTYTPANLIIPRLWLGDINAAQDQIFIRNNNIKTVFNCTKGAPFLMEIQNKYRVPVDDNLQEDEIRNMARWSSEIVYTVLKHYSAGDTILIHCMAGRQRSAAVMAMALIALENIHTNEAMSRIRSQRVVAFSPQANFAKSIQYFDNLYHNEIRPAILARCAK